MNQFIDNIKEIACVYDRELDAIQLNGIHKDCKLIELEIKNHLKKLLNSGKKELICRTNNIELLIFHLCSWKNKEIFIVKKTSEIEDVLLNIENIKLLKDEIDMILSAIYDDILITDGKGIIRKVFSSFEKVYNVRKEEIEGKSVFEMEKLGIFRPSITALALKSGEQITMVQETKDEKQLIVTASPIKNQQGEIVKVISFTRDLTDFIKLKEQYARLENKVERYSMEIEELREKNKTYPKIIGNSKKIHDIIATIDKVSKFDASIFIEGESGVGKTMFARILHAKSKRVEGPLIEINCGSIPENLLESELFGYEKGAFTGANPKGKIGLIEVADKGTLFLDEIGELPLNLQMKLLKVIQDKKITRIGGLKDIDVDFRLVTATNQNLKQLIHEGKFREDLYYRLNVVNICVPPIRERKEDIIHLSMHFLDQYNKKYNQNKRLSSEILDYFMEYQWPGNIRELENLIERMVLVSNQDIIEIQLVPHMQYEYFKRRKSKTLQQSLQEYEKQLVVEAYAKWKSTVGVAKELGISQPTAVRKIKKYVYS
ncbi:sigma 54-interacting transcriptional regulator [Clostridiaceae bacterium 35-E11]